MIDDIPEFVGMYVAGNAGRLPGALVGRQYFLREIGRNSRDDPIYNELVVGRAIDVLGSIVMDGRYFGNGVAKELKNLADPRNGGLWLPKVGKEVIVAAGKMGVAAGIRKLEFRIEEVPKMDCFSSDWDTEEGFKRLSGDRCGSGIGSILYREIGISQGINPPTTLSIP
jgi:hypothetical protein